MARIYDTLLGGDGWPAVDQQAACDLLRLVPGAVTAAHQNRGFVHRVVRHLADHAGIRQFIDIGAGLPASPDVHEIARQFAPITRVLYADCDPDVIARVQAMLADDPLAEAIHGDLRDPDGILGHPALRALINLDEPVAVLLTAVLHYVEDDAEPYKAVDAIKKALVPGSFVAVTHATGDDTPSEIIQRVRKLYRSTTAPLTPRSRSEVARFLDGLELVRPGVVNGSAWRPGHVATDPRQTRFYAAVGTKR